MIQSVTFLLQLGLGVVLIAYVMVILLPVLESPARLLAFLATALPSVALLIWWFDYRALVLAIGLAATGVLLFDAFQRLRMRSRRSRASRRPPIAAARGTALSRGR